MHTLAYMKALSDETRLRCFRALATSPAALCVAELVDILMKPQYAISKAVLELRRAGLAREERQGKLVFYSLSGLPEAIALGRWVVDYCACHSPQGLYNSDGSLQPGADPCAYDAQRLEWRLGVRSPDGVVRVTYPRLHQNPDPRPGVLFVCVHNSARSQLAEEYLRLYAPDRFRVESAGLVAGTLNPWVVRHLLGEGVDIQGKKTRAVGDLYRSGLTWRWVITVCSREAERDCPVFPGPVCRLSWPFEDPAGFRGTDSEIQLEVARVAAQIQCKVREFIDANTAQSPLFHTEHTGVPHV